MNTIIETILNHRSIRHYEDRPLSDEQIRLIVESAQAAATSHFVQAYTILGIQDPGRKQKLAELTGNRHVGTCGHLLIFCADLHKHELAAQMEGVEAQDTLETTEKFMVALIDTALAAQNAALAAESMGLGICYVGGLRNRLPEVAELLKIPQYVLPLFAMTIGYPADPSAKKPRMEAEHVYFEDEYPADERLLRDLKEYNETVSQYYTKRTNGKRNDTWTGQMAQFFKEPSRVFMKEFVERQGFDKK
ncbi:oxygen-insensitive NADPH nitroreductase [Weizmannia coagulans]|uniref:FMN reductase n=2 Tax=Heyndrickxia TaxID=2837504 RepID=A0AAN0T3U1_HEYCO|nr:MULTISPECIES: oxygen-insensitive NADPH nitroreductase [Heyndrickxia]AJO21533.1 FMN reductase [Heyndrickxia coagulans]AKN52847.1 Oxygen-insensitive NADPH nitroreductase [Heyndrickxia coagulans]ATW82088.1 oxygen-insensitive NADPH nitroreductase [Heyndrickxia coagulans]KGB29419.1 NADPH-dependent oxidoreductase [Heyndrickxia coagulans]KXT21657.1 NADPH-dependent oxidoreductase [Heyndrickxia coagulans]